MYKGKIVRMHILGEVHVLQNTEQKQTMMKKSFHLEALLTLQENALYFPMLVQGILHLDPDALGKNASRRKMYYICSVLSHR